MRSECTSIYRHGYFVATCISEAGGLFCWPVSLLALHHVAAWNDSVDNRGVFTSSLLRVGCGAWTLCCEREPWFRSYGSRWCVLRALDYCQRLAKEGAAQHFIHRPSVATGCDVRDIVQICVASFMSNSIFVMQNLCVTLYKSFGSSRSHET